MERSISSFSSSIRLLAYISSVVSDRCEVVITVSALLFIGAASKACCFNSSLQLRSCGLSFVGSTISHMIYNRHKYRLSYFLEYAPLKTVVESVLAPLFESIKNGEFENDDLTRIEYEDTLKQFNVPIIQH